MKVYDDIISGFGDENNNSDSPLDFSLAQKIERSGSTCDAYITRYRRRRVFIKRLKEKYRTSPRHLAALDKEYDIGVTLKHRSLPEYREYHEDYLIMDYIDGVTLADMLSYNDPWLSKEANVRGMLTELVDVIDYLHQHNVVHCDIKPDNILLTRGARNLVLVDLDKAYTSWLDDTSGDAHLYGVESIGSTDIDFHGVGKIVERLSNSISGFPSRRFKEFAAECFRKGTTPDALKNKLSKSYNKTTYVIMISALTVISTALLFYFNSPNQELKVSSQVFPTGAIMSTKDTVVISNEAVTESAVKEVVREAIKEESEKSDEYKEIIAKEMSVRITQMDKLYQEANILITDSASTNDELYDFVYTIIEHQSDLTMKAYADYQEKFPDKKPLDIQNAVVSCEAYVGMLKKNDELVQRLSDEMERRKTLTSIENK